MLTGLPCLLRWPWFSMKHGKASPVRRFTPQTPEQGRRPTAIALRL
jgi:hypothetical protein